MKRFPIFRTGKHTASSGVALEFSDAQLKDAVAAYDTAVHEAPIVVGHPQHNHPAYGWVASLAFNEQTGEIEADPAQLEPSFSEMVEAGRFKKRSASWYLPDAPNNPKPGTLYLRHVGFLGAQPPAIKGLKDVDFADAEQGVVEFGDNRWAWSSMASLARGWREWLISKFDLETADKVVPNFLLSDIEAAAKADPDTTPAVPAYSEDPTMDAATKARLDALEAENAQLKANQKPADFAEKETALAARETSLQAREQALAAAEQVAARTRLEARLDGIIKAGRMLPAQKKAVADFAMSLGDKEATLDFGEGDKAKKVTQRESYLLQLEAAPKAVEFGELAPGTDGAPGGTTPEAVSEKAREIHAKAAVDGKHISFTEAVAQATRELAA